LHLIGISKMTTFYMDLEAGNDAADGLSFANRWKTFDAGATAARIAPGDTIRIMKSPDPVDTGIQATWTDGSEVVTLASALTETVDMCESGWTGVTNSTVSHSTTNREGTNAAQVAIAAGFTTGKAAYKNLGSTVDFSAYKQISFWFRANAVLAANVLTINLCSDTAGATPVDTLNIPQYFKANTWQCMTINKGSALGSAIQSVALYAASDPGTVAVLLDCIIACKDPTSVDAITLDSLISKNSAGEGWWGIRSISGTTVRLDNGGAVPGNNILYGGTTETVDLWRRETIKIPKASTDACIVQDSGTAGNLITFQGGYDRTSMSTLDGETWIDGQNYSNVGLGALDNPGSYISVDKLAFVRYSSGYNGALTLSTINLVQTTNNSGTGFNELSNRYYNSITVGFVNQNASTGVVINSAAPTITVGKVIGNRSTGATLGGSAAIASVGPCLRNQGVGLAIFSVNNRVTVGDVKNNSAVTATSGITIGGANNTLINTGEIDNPAANYGIDISSATFNTRLINAVTSNHVVSSVRISTGRHFAKNCTFNEGSVVAFSSITLTGALESLFCSSFGGDPTDTRIIYSAGTASLQSSVRHTASGYAWQINCLNAAADLKTALILPLDKFLVAANAAVTVSIWARRTSSAITGSLRVRGMQLAGVDNDVLDSISVDNTWEELQVQFTPTEAGVIELEFLVYGGTADSVYIDDISVTQ